MSAGLTFISCGLMVVPSTALNSQSQNHGLWVREVGQLRLNGINRPTSPPHFHSTLDWWNDRRNVGLVSQKCGIFYGWPIIKEKEKWPVNRGTYFTSHGWLFSFSWGNTFILGLQKFKPTGDSWTSVYKPRTVISKSWNFMLQDQFQDCVGNHMTSRPLQSCESIEMSSVTV